MKVVVAKMLVTTGIFYGLVGIILIAGGIWLAALGGALYYVVAGLGIFITGILLIGRQRSALWVYAAVLGGTLIWAISEIGFDWWPLAARGDVIFPLALWLLTPWVAGNLNPGSGLVSKATLPLWIAVAVGAVVLAIGLSSTYHERDGKFAATNTAVRSFSQPSDSGQPDEDWRDYGRSQFGQRYSPLTQITPDNVNQLKVAWTFRTGDLPGENDPVETTFEVTPIKVRDTLYLCSQHQTAVRAGRKDRKASLVVRSKAQGQSDLSASHLSRSILSRERPTAVDTEGKPVTADCPHMVFLPVNDGRMIALDADSGKPCESFADHGTLDLQQGMGVKTAGFYEPTSPPVVSDKILVIGGAVIDNYSTEEPSGVIRGFDIHTGKLVWAWDSGAADENALPSATHNYTNNSPNSWITASYDAQLRLLYLPMGVHTPDIWGGNRDPLRSAIRARWWRSTSTPANGSGPIRPCITISGTWICRRSRRWSICRRERHRSRPSWCRQRPAISSCSTAATDSRSCRRQSGRCRKARRRAIIRRRRNLSPN